MDTERADVKDARTEAEWMMQLGHPVAYATVQTLLKDLRDAGRRDRLVADRSEPLAGGLLRGSPRGPPTRGLNLTANVTLHVPGERLGN